MSETQKHPTPWTIANLQEQVARIADQSLRRWQIGRTISVLQRLDDELLRDIGITRGEIASVARRVNAARPARTGKPRPVARPMTAREVTT